MKTAVVVSANAEWDGLKLLFPDAKIHYFPYGECFQEAVAEWPVTFFHSGWGKTASAGALQYILDRHQPDLVVNLGTCGGFAGPLSVGR